jgi:tetratricopeptide (TPR) repeat protein
MAATTSWADVSQYDQGKAYYQAGNWQSALNCFNQLLSDPASPDVAEANYWIGLCYERMGRSADAIASFQAQVAQFPSNRKSPAAMINIGKCYIDNKQYDQALAEYNQALQNYPGKTLEMNYYISECYRAQGNYAEAITALKTGLASVTDKASADQFSLNLSMRSLADCYRQLNDYDNTIAAYNDLIATFPDNANEFRFGLAECYTAKSDYDRAITLYSQLAGGSAADALRAHFYIGWCYQCQEKYTEALGAYRTAITSAPADTPKDDYCYQMAKLHIAECYLGLGDFDSSAAEYLEVAQDCPSEAGHYKLDAADRYLNKKDFAKVIALCEEVLANNPESKGRALLLMGKCQQATGDPADAQASFDQALTALQNPSVQDHELQSQILMQRSEVYARYVQDYDKAIAELQKVLTDYPGSSTAVEAELQIARLYQNYIQDTVQAETLLRAFMSNHSDYKSMIAVACDLASCSYNHGNWTDAIAEFQRARNYPAVENYQAEILYMISDCYMRLKDHANAKTYADTLLATYPTTDWASLAARNYVELISSETEYGGK